MQQLLTIKQVALELGYSYEAIRKMIKQGSIPAIRLHKQRIRIKKSWLDKTLADYPTATEFNQLKEDIRFDADNQPKTIANIPAKPETSEIIISKEDEMSKKANTENTEILASTPKVNKFVPNPKKRIQKSTEVKEPENEYQDDNELDNDNDSFMDDSDNGNSDKDFLSDYKGIGNY
jgi:excisionase family DNA binding protein